MDAYLRFEHATCELYVRRFHTELCWHLAVSAQPESAFVVFELLYVDQAFVDVAHLFHGQALLVFVLAAS